MNNKDFSIFDYNTNTEVVVFIEKNNITKQYEVVITHAVYADSGRSKHVDLYKYTKQIASKMKELNT